MSGCMIRNDGKCFEVDDRIIFDVNDGENFLSNAAWFYSHTKCIVSGYEILRLFVIWSRKKNKHLSPYKTLLRDKNTGYFTDEYLERIKAPLEEIDFRMRMGFEGLDSGAWLPYIYEDEFHLHKRLLGIQLKQEFIYAEKENREPGSGMALEIFVDSIYFDWSKVIKDYIGSAAPDQRKIKITKNGVSFNLNLDEVTADFWDMSCDYRDNFNNRRKEFKDGKSIYSILFDAGYAWSRVLQRVWWIYQREGTIRQQERGGNHYDQ